MNTYSKSYTKKTKLWLEEVLIISLIVLIALHFILGPYFSSFSEFIEGLKNINNNAGYKVIFKARLLRILACILVGSALSVAGLLLQVMLNNSLAAPGTVGINSGAGLSIVIVSLFASISGIGLTISTFIGAFLTAMLIYLIARVTGASRNKLILAGIAISRLFSAAIDAICYFSPSVLTNKLSFQLGSFTRISMSSLIFSGMLIILGLIGALIISKYLSILSLGDDVAISLGLDVKLTRFLLLLIVAVLSAGAVSIAGLLSFLGLIVPHIIRKLIGVENQRRLVILTILFGSSLTLLCDLLSKTIFMPFELPVGIIMSLIGIPFFIFLLFSKGGTSRVVKDRKPEVQSIE